MENRTIVIGVIAAIVVLLIAGVALSSSSSSSGGVLSDTSSPSYIVANAQLTTPQQLYKDRGELVGKPVKFKGELMDSNTNNVRVKGINMSYNYNMDMHDVMVSGDFSNVTAYENDEVWVYGIFAGKVTYQTIMGANRSIPGVESAWIEPTGKSY